MGKVLEFKPRTPDLTPEEEAACRIARSLREQFSDEQLERIKRELEREEGALDDAS